MEQAYEIWAPEHGAARRRSGTDAGPRMREFLDEKKFRPVTGAVETAFQ